MKKLDVLVAMLLIVGGLNWGLIGAFQFDLVNTLFGDMGMIPTVLYTLCGFAAVYSLYGTLSNKKETPAEERNR